MLVLGPILALSLRLVVSACATEPVPSDASVLSHGSPTGEVIPAPTITKEMGKAEDQPLPLRLIMSPLKNDRGMVVRLPMIDTDPNRGITIGFLPVWILNNPKEDRITAMHAPSLTFNPTFKSNWTYRYFYYPTKDSTLMLRGSIAQVAEKEAFLQYDNSNLFDKFGEWGAKLQYNVDASNRFFGFGPTTAKTAVSNYALATLIDDFYFGLPFYRGSHWYWTVEQRLAGNRVGDGPVKGVQKITTLYPSVVPAHYHQSSTARGYITYDTLDNSVTTTRGTYAEFFAESSQRGIASEYTFQRYSADVRHFIPTTKDDTCVTAMRLKFEQVIGDGVPLWLQPYLGGKYTFPAYGDGRFTTRGVAATVIEERVTVFRIKEAGVNVRFEAAPFMGVGSAFDTQGKMNRRYARPLFGLGLRAVAPPQVVGSIDIGIGQEGMNTFMDINYPF